MIKPTVDYAEYKAKAGKTEDLNRWINVTFNIISSPDSQNSKISKLKIK